MLRIRMPVDQFHQEGYSHMKKSITLSLVLAASLGLAACGEKAADDTAATTEDTAATVEGAADGAMDAASGAADAAARSEEHTSELQSLMRISYAVFCLKKKKHSTTTTKTTKR